MQKTYREASRRQWQQALKNQLDLEKAGAPRDKLIEAGEAVKTAQHSMLKVD